MTEAEYKHLQKELSLKLDAFLNPRQGYHPNRDESSAYEKAILGVKSILSNYHKSNYEKLLENEGKDKDTSYIKTDGDVFTGICTISSVHISEQTAQRLDELEDVTVSFKEYDQVRSGAYVYWDEYDDLSGLPEDLADCIRFAKEHGCSCLCLDCDGKELGDFLPVYARELVIENIEREERE